MMSHKQIVKKDKHVYVTSTRKQTHVQLREVNGLRFEKDSAQNRSSNKPTYNNSARNITVDNWPFSNQFQHLADQTPF